MEKQEQLHVAIRKGDASEVERLLSNGVNINCMFYGWTPFQLAVEIGNQEMALLLIEKGCNFLMHDKSQNTPFEEAVMKKQTLVVNALLKKRVSGDIILTCEETPLTYAVKSECIDLATTLIQGGVDVNMQNAQGDSALYMSAKDGQKDMVRLLLSAGAHANFVCQHGGFTPLIAAAANDNLHVVSLLVKHNCQLNTQESDGWTALWHGYNNSNEDICRVLLRAGADKNIPNADGQTVVQHAIENEEEAMVELFQKYNNLV